MPGWKNCEFGLWSCVSFQSCWASSAETWMPSSSLRGHVDAFINAMNINFSVSKLIAYGFFPSYDHLTFLCIEHCCTEEGHWTFSIFTIREVLWSWLFTLLVTWNLLTHCPLQSCTDMFICISCFWRTISYTKLYISRYILETDILSLVSLNDMEKARWLPVPQDTFFHHSSRQFMKLYISVMLEWFSSSSWTFTHHMTFTKT